jgi:hypothetical protein
MTPAFGVRMLVVLLFSVLSAVSITISCLSIARYMYFLHPRIRLY